MSWLKNLHAPTSRRNRQAESRRRPGGKPRLVETLEHRLMLAADTPFTIDGLPWTVAARGASVIEAENYDFGGEGVAYHSSYATNPGGAYRPTEGVGIEGPSASTGGTYNVGYFGAGNWLNYTVNVAQAGTYVVDLRAATATQGATAHVTFGAGGASKATPTASTGAMLLPGTGGWQNYQDLTATVTLAAGRQIMTVWDDASGYNLDAIKLIPQADAGSREQPYSPSATAPGATNRGLPTVLPTFGAAQIESENYDVGGQASSPTGVQAAGYNWLNANQIQGTYPYTSVPFRPGEVVDLANRGTGLATTNWKGGEWLQYTVLAASDSAPLNPAATQPATEAISPTTQYQMLVSYANAGTQTAQFTISSTYTNPTTGATTLAPVGTLTLAPTGGIYNYATATASITLPGFGLNTLRFTDADAAGANSNVDIDNFRLINARTSGNGGLPWTLSASGATVHIGAPNYDIAPGGAVFPAGTSPTVAPTADSTGGGSDVQKFAAGDALTYTINPILTSKYQLALRVRNSSGVPAVMQVTFDAGASFGTVGPNNQTPSPVVFTFNVPAGAGYQTITTATNTSALPQTTNPWVEIPSGPQTMQVKVLSGQVDYHYAELAAITTTQAKKADPNQLGSYAAEPPNSVLNTVSDLFPIVYNTHYKWINPPANATVPTNDWWTNILLSPFAGDMYAFPEKINDSAAGVAISGFSGVGTDSTGGSIQPTGQQSLVVGGAGSTFQQDALLDYGDWTVHYRMQTTAAGSVDVTAGRGLPYTWFEFNGVTPTLTMHRSTDANQTAFTAYDASGNALGATFTTDHFRLDTGGQPMAVFAPTGTTFTRSGGTYTVTFAPGAKPYLVTAVLPDSSNATLATYYQHAYAIPRQVGATPSSKNSWDPYNAAAGQIVTHWTLNTVSIDPAAPAGTLAAQGNLGTLQGWLPIDTSDGASGLTLLTGSAGQPLRYSSLNGDITVAAGTKFTVSQTTAGVNFQLALPQVINAPQFTYDPAHPGNSTVSTNYDPQVMRGFLQTYIQQHTNTAASAAAGTTILTYGDDTYFGAKPLQEYAELAMMAKQIGDSASFNILLSNLRTFMTDWFTYDPTRDTTSHFFTYYPGSHALIGFSPSFGSEDFTDNHFHYGYFTAAAGVLAMLDPTWGAQYGAMAKMVAMQYANWLHPGDAAAAGLNSDATSLPFLRTFEPWIGHSYAGGTGSYNGNNQESTSEAIQSWLGLILLGQALNDPAMTSAGMMGYTMESKAVEEQWFNTALGNGNANGTGLPSTFADASGQHSNVGIDFDGGKGYGTYFGTNPEYILGIQALPIWPSLDFLGRDARDAAAATQNMLNERNFYYNQAGNNPTYDPAHPGTYNTFASFDNTGGFGGPDWLNINLGFQATYNPQATANEYARIIAQATPTAAQGTTGLYYFIDHSYQTYGTRDFGYHLSVPLGGVYTHGADGTTMAGTLTYMAYNSGSTATQVLVYNASGTVVDQFLAQPGFNTVTRSTATGGHAPPLITTGPASSPATVTGTSTTLSVLAHDDQQNESTLTYTWALVSGPANAAPTFAVNGTNAAKTTSVTFKATGSYLFSVTVTDSHGLKTTSTVAVSVVPTLSKMILTPGSGSLFTGSNRQFSVSGTDQFGVTITQPTVTWTVSSGAGSISTTGLYQASNTPGTATITATSGTTSASVTVTVLNQLPAPTGLAATVAANYGAVDLSWTAPAGSVTGYNVYRGTTPGEESTSPLNSTPITGTAYHDAAVAPTVTYYYVVVAVNNGGASPASSEVAATTAPDLALNAPVHVSSVENNATPGSNAVDGNSTTRWSSQFSDPQWIDVALGARYNVAEVRLNWEAAAGCDYQIQVSDDEINWTTIRTVTGNTTGGIHNYAGLTGVGSFVRVLGTSRLTPYGYSLFDFNVYGTRVVTASVPAAPTGLTATPSYGYEVDLAWIAPAGTVTGYNVYRGTTPGGESSTPINATPVTATTYRDTTVTPGVTYYYTVVAVNASGSGQSSAEATATTPRVTSTDLALNRPVVASSVENAAFPASSAVDGDSGTRWSSQFSDSQWIAVDLGSSYNINEVRLNWEAAAGRDYQIQDSTDNVTWTTLKSVTGNITAGLHDYTGLSGIGRFVRLLGTARLTQYGYSLFDLNVFGSGTTTGVTPLDRSWWQASASNTEPGGSATNAIDSSPTSRWTTGAAQSAGQWFQVDLGSMQTFDRLTFDAGNSVNDYARGYQIQVSDNGSDWSTQPSVASGSGTGPLVTVNLGAPVKHRCIRIMLTAPADYWWSISDLNVYV